LSRLGSLGIGGGGGGGLLGKVTGKLKPVESKPAETKPREAKPAEQLKPATTTRVSLSGRRSPTLTGERGTIAKEPNRKCSTPHANHYEHHCLGSVVLELLSLVICRCFGIRLRGVPISR